MVVRIGLDSTLRVLGIINREGFERKATLNEGRKVRESKKNYLIVQTLMPRFDSIRARLLRVEHCHILQVYFREQAADVSIIVLIVIVTMRVAAALVMMVVVIAPGSDYLQWQTVRMPNMYTPCPNRLCGIQAIALEGTIDDGNNI